MLHTKLRYALANPIIDSSLQCSARVTEIFGDFDSFSAEASEIGHRYRDSFLVMIDDAVEIGDLIDVSSHGFATKKDLKFREKWEKTIILWDPKKQIELGRVEHVFNGYEFYQAIYGLNHEHGYHAGEFYEENKSGIRFRIRRRGQLMESPKRTLMILAFIVSWILIFYASGALRSPWIDMSSLCLIATAVNIVVFVCAARHVDVCHDEYKTESDPQRAYSRTQK
jgi:hypothetical protein